MSKNALILNANREGATKVYLNGKSYAGVLSGMTWAPGGAGATLTFGAGDTAKEVKVKGVTFEQVEDWPIGTKLVDGFGVTRTIRSKGAEGVALGRLGQEFQKGSPAKIVKVSFDELVANYTRADLAIAPNCECDDED